MIATRMRQAASGSAGAAPPDAPTDLTAVQDGANVDLTWTNNAVGDGVKVYRSADGVIFAEIDDIAPGSTTYTDTTITGGITYWYYVAAYNSGGESDSNTVAFNTLVTNLISFWELEEASGDRIDAHSSNDLTDVNTVTSNPGKVGDAAQFAIVNAEELTHIDNASLSTGNIDFAVGAWVRLDSLPTVASIIVKWDSGTGQREYMLNFQSSRFRFFVSSNGIASASVVADTFGAVSTATWYFVAGWHDAVNDIIGISVNGVIDTAAHAGGVFDSSALFRLGNAGFGNGYMGGRIDQALFSKKVWTADERASLYNSGNGRAYAYINP